MGTRRQRLSTRSGTPSHVSINTSFNKRRDWRSSGLAFALFGILATPASAQYCTENASCQPKFNFNGYDKGAKTVINNCTTNTSESPCAWADATDKKESVLACSLENTGPIALCYYSGVPGMPYYTPSCTFSQNKNAAECDCYQIDANTPKAPPYSFVLISGILNKQVYEETVAQCGFDGSDCLNFSDLKSGKKRRRYAMHSRTKHCFLVRI